MLELLNKDLNGEKSKDIIGLTSDEVEFKQKQFGKNIFQKRKKPSALKIFNNQFKDILVLILIAATGISALIGEIYDAITILIIVLINAIIGFIQEYKTEKTLISLDKLTAPTANVYRDGTLQNIPAEEIVIGDVIKIKTGDRIPCDAYILEENLLSCDESVLTGESNPVSKSKRNGEKYFEELNLDYMVYLGCTVTRGNATIVCTSIGHQTQMGKVSNILNDITPSPTPLQIKLAELSKILAFICLIVCSIVTVAGIIRGENPFDMLMTGIAIAIAAIPEGLPATVTIALALAVSRMAKQKALARKLHSVETLGCATYICTDKTGTLTQNKMSVYNISTINESYDTKKDNKNKSVLIDNKKALVNPLEHYDLYELVRCSVACNNARVDKNEINVRDRGKIKSRYKTSGEPLEVALKLLGADNNIDELSEGFFRISEIPFESENKKMSVCVKDSKGQIITYIKGALDVLLNNCEYYYDENSIKKLTPDKILLVNNKRDALSKKGLRVIAFSKVINQKSIFLGIAGLIDPLRPEIKSSVTLCKKAGIKVIMLTGDHLLTATEIAKQSGIISDDSEAINASYIEKIDDDELKEILKTKKVFARVSPIIKLRIIKTLRDMGEVVAMTGDGVNDAPAIKESSVGISMGAGTDVTKSASDITLIDDNFKTIVMATKNGRGIYQNIRKFVRYLLSCNIGEVCVMFLGILMGLPMVLFPVQILLVNLVTDGLPAVALGLEPVGNEVMNMPPRKSDESFLSNGLLSTIVFRGIFIGLCTLAVFVLALSLGEGEAVARTSALFTLILSQLIHVFECKSERKSLFKINPFDNIFLIVATLLSFITLIIVIYVPSVAVIFKTVPLSFKMLLISVVSAFLVPIFSALIKKIK